MALLPWRNALLTHIKEHSAATRSFYFRTEDGSAFDFKPGQFITLDLPIHEKANKRLRSYSVANAPDGSAAFELLVQHTPGGAGSTYLFEELKEGGLIRFRGPQGIFTLPPAGDGPLYFICTGTGVAPFRSMLQYIHQHQLSYPPVTLIFGTRTQHGLLYKEEWTALEKEWPSFQYIPVLSQEKWDGATGRVHAIYESLIHDKPGARFFLCGWKDMIDEARERLQALGFPKEAVHFELYG